MTITTTDARLEVFRPADDPDGDPRHVLDGHDIESLSLSERIGWRKDTGSITLHNDNGRHDETITSGDELRFYADLGTPEYDRPVVWGDETTPWGAFAWPGERLIWGALARAPGNDPEGPQRETISIEAEDYALGVLAKRNVFESFEDWPIAAIIQRLIDAYAPELTVSIDASGRLSQSTTAAWAGATLYDALDTIASRADAVIRSHGPHLHVEPFDLAAPRFEATPAHDFGLVDWDRDDDSLVNHVRVDGSQQPILEEDASREEQASYQTVTEDSPVFVQLTTRVSELSEIHLYTRTRDDEPNVTLALQNDDDGEPSDPDDPSQNLARRNQSSEFISDDGWTEFPMPSPNRTLRDNPWLIIRADGGTLDLGVAADGAVTRRVYYPQPVATLRQDTRSKNRYRRRDERLSIDGASLADARERGAAELRRNARPDLFIDLEAVSHRMHMLRPGDLVTVTDVREMLAGDYLLVEREDSFDGKDIETALSLQQVGSI